MAEGPAGVEPSAGPDRAGWALLASAFVVATCGLVYELLAGTLASYLLGDSVTQFSTVIGTYLFAMGLGAWASRAVVARELAMFIRVEILIAAIGGPAAALLFLAFDRVADFRLPLYGLVLVIGTLVGLEIPLLMRILKDRLAFADLVSRVLAFDYVGALAASLLFPLVLVPQLGLIRTGFLFGLANVGVALALLAMLPRRGLRGEWLAGWLVAAGLLAGLLSAERLERLAEVATYDAPVIHAVSTPYQRIALTRSGDDLRLYLNGNLQFASRDEYRYHEALVHPALGRVARPARVLVLGGGDGLAVREILKHPIGQITLVDLDPAMTRLFGQSSLLTALNGGSLSNPRVRVINADAFQWLRAATGRYDAIIVDLPDPTNYSLGKLYSLSFYRELARVLAPGGVAVVQSTSPLIARRAYWTVATTLEAAGLFTRAYHAYVPSFGEWGFVLAAHTPIADQPARLPPALRFWDAATEAQAGRFPADMARLPVPVNRLDNQALVRVFETEWGAVTG